MGTNKFVENIINKTFQTFQQFKICIDYSTIINKILCTVWPLLIRPDPIKFLQQLKYLSSKLNLNSKHACFMAHYSNKLQPKYPSYCLKHTLQYFQVPQQQIKYDLLINVLVGQQCIDTLVKITKFNIHKQIVSSQENQFIQEDKISAMTTILDKLFSHKTNIIRFIRQIKDQSALVKYLDQWLVVSNNDYMLNIFRALKIIIVCQCLYEIRCQEQSENNKFKQPIVKIINQISHRFLNRLFNRNLKQKILILEWILQGRIWIQNEDLKNSLIPYLITCYQVHKNKENPYRNRLSQKIQKQQQKLIFKYLLKVKSKYFGPINFKLKVPKYYLKLKLGLVEEDIPQQPQSRNSLLKNTSGTVSLGKIGTESINLQYQNQLLTKCSFDKLIVSVFKYTQNIQLHIVYIILQVLQQQLKNNQNQLKQAQTDTQRPKHIQKYQPKQNNFMKLFYRVIKSIKQYSSIFQQNKLTQQINKIISSFAIYFEFCTIRELHRTDLHDLEMIVNNDVVLENLSANLLRNTRYHALSTIYEVQVAQNIMNSKSISDNNTNNKTISSKKNKKQSQESKLDNKNSQKSMFINSLGDMVQLFTRKQEQIQFLCKIAMISDIKITQTLFLNLFYYLFVRTSKNGQKQRKKKISQLENIIQKLFKYYFQTDNHTDQSNNIVKILATAHKIFENWRKSTRKSCSFNENNLNSWIVQSHQQERNISQFYWKIMISNSSKGTNIQYAKHFQKANCIKQSIYWMQLRHKYQFPIKSTIEEAQWLYNLHARLQDHLNQCKPYVYNQIGRDKDEILKTQKQNTKKSNKDELKWFSQIKFLTNNLNNECYASIVYNNAIKIWQYQQIQQVDQILHQIFVLCTYFQTIKNENYYKLHENLQKLNQRDICLSIVKCLNINKQSVLRRELDKKRYLQKQCQILSVIYNQKLRFNQLEELQLELGSIPVQNMNVEQIRASIILYSKIQQFDKVRLMFRYLKDCPAHYKQEIQFYNMQAIYKSTMMYSADKMIQNLQKIIRYIQQQKKSQRINKSSTNPLFESFKFICENYRHLTLEQQKKIINCLNRYLKKVYQCQNYVLSTEAAYFILRFILIQSTNSSKLSTITTIFPYQMYGASILQPHKELLICSIGESPQKDSFIKKLLIKIAENDPKASSWWIYGLKNHCQQQIDKKGKQFSNSVDESTQRIGHQIYQQLKKKYIKLDEEFQWIGWLATAPPGSDLKKIPDNMVSPFSKEVILQKVIRIQNLGHGKSKPIRIQFRASKNKKSLSIYIIRKLITNFKSQFRTQSATANFFKDCKLLDQQITYSIIHLSKYCLLVQHIQHKATLDFLLNNNIQHSELKKMTNVMEIIKGNKLSVMSFAYDKPELQLNFKLFQFFFSSSSTIIKSWWQKYRNFLKTYAQWCFLGYIVGLGDRHTNNILVTEEGRVIHIDFQYIFDSGKFLPSPQWVPFRLTRGFLSQICSIEPYGLLYSQFIKTSIRYKEKIRQIWHAQSHFSFMKKKDMSNQINKRAQLKNRPFQQTQLLIKRSTSTILLRDMYFGWGSFK